MIRLLQGNIYLLPTLFIHFHLPIVPFKRKLTCMWHNYETDLWFVELCHALTWPSRLTCRQVASNENRDVTQDIRWLRRQFYSHNVTLHCSCYHWLSSPGIILSAWLGSKHRLINNNHRVSSSGIPISVTETKAIRHKIQFRVILGEVPYWWCAFIWGAVCQLVFLMGSHTMNG